MVVNMYKKGNSYQKKCKLYLFLGQMQKSSVLLKKLANVAYPLVDFLSFFHTESQWDDKAKANDAMRDKSSKANAAKPQKSADDDDEDFDSEEDEEEDEDSEHSDL